MVKRICQHCGKGVMKGHQVSHSKQRTRKFFRPNLHWARIIINGNRKRMLLCAIYIKTLKNKNTSKLGLPALNQIKDNKKTGEKPVLKAVKDKQENQETSKTKK